LQQLGRQAEALTDYVRVVEHAAATSAAIRRRYSARIGRGTALLALDRTDEARVELNRALDTEPVDAVAYDRAELRLALARTETAPVRALELAREAHQLASNAEATALVADVARWLATH